MQKISFIIPIHRLYSKTVFIQLIEKLLEFDLGLLVLVDDASGGIYDSTFKTFQHKTNLKILRHAVALGHGAALKTGFNYLYCHHRDHLGAVIIDANQQYSNQDILNLTKEFLKSPHVLIQGTRKQNNTRAKLGFRNSLATLLIGIKMEYLNLGLKALPMAFIPKCLRIKSNSYDFDIDLLLLCKFNNIPIQEFPMEGPNLQNRLELSDPFLLSMKIIFVLLRFFLVSVITAGVDLILFLTIYSISASLAWGMIVSRCTAMFINYRLIRRRVFYSQEKNYKVMCKYFLTVIFFGVLSYLLINLLKSKFGFSVVSAKLLVESTLFFINLLVQRDIVFVSDENYPKTDWDYYYENPFPSAKFTRRIMENEIISNINKFSVPMASNQGKLIELGGANSCFLDGIFNHLHPQKYIVADNNKVGLQKLQNRTHHRNNVVLLETDIFDLVLDEKADVAFSVGLIEHFSPEGTRKVIDVHFDTIKDGGIVLLTFPTSTWLYHCTRFFSELLGIWIFTDERPLHKSEVLEVMSMHGELLYSKILWSMFLTQTVVVARKS